MTRRWPRSGPSAGIRPLCCCNRSSSTASTTIRTDVAVKLEQTRRHQQQLATRYAHACAAAEARD